MPLLCISLLLLPLALGCGSQKALEELRGDYAAVVQTDLDNAKERISTLQQNSSCPKLRQRPQSCMPRNSTEMVGTIHNLTCQMAGVRFSLTEQLVRSVLTSLECTCPSKLTKGAKVKTKRTAITPTKKRQGRHLSKKLCKVTAILSSMTRCYEMLNDT
ncbi:uncharacterized protein LOC133569572 isoform X2 [Nerophis ophidion]|uniref:uncharacterized protein LOC133569572 isoform X2 n=1 Tax=Nerophis ophidion TaxID=159077 RepID=UPI002ADF8B76|nr:uncharacterized protein LOC133569572 isoform X2 [Nerophis ophidion]